MANPREIELKLELDSAGVGSRLPAGLRRLPGVVGGRRLRSRYFDTADLALHREGLTLRVRGDGEGFVQTVKREAGTSLIERPEWEITLRRDEPDLAAAVASGAPAHLQEVGALVPVFETRIARTAWRFERGGSDIELVFDQGEVATGAQASPIREIELELKGGAPGELFRLARELARRMPLRLGIQSKSERGYRLVTGSSPGPAKAEKLHLAADADAGEAFRAVALACLRHFRLNEAGIIDGRDPESLHQARVAIRRLRSAFTLFRPVIDDDESRRLMAALRRLSAALGEARNLDVYLSRRIGSEVERQPGEPGLPELRTRIEVDRERAYDRIVRRLRSAPFRVLTIDLLAFVEDGDWRRDEAGSSTRGGPARDFAASVLDRRWRKLRKSGRHLDKLAPADRHEVRIAAKKLRYASEFFAGLFRGKEARRRHKDFVAALEGLQGELGSLNDIATGHEMAVSLARGLDGTRETPALLFAAGHLSGEADAHEAELLRAAAEAHKAIRKAKPFWA